MDYPTKQETIYKIAILDLLIAIDEDIVDWRNFPLLYQAVRCADVALDLWAGMNLEQIKEETEAYLRGMEDYEEEP
jgi:hypothetical protein